MTARCPHCQAELAPGQPLCTDCGAPVSAAATLKGAAATRAPDDRGQETTAPRRDKAKDFERVGELIAGKYKVLEVLGQGGFGTVYLVEIVAGMVGERLALKLLPAGLSREPILRNQFLNEIRVAMKMVDKYIVQIRDVGTTEDDLLYYTMDFCPGTTLADVLKREGKLALPRTLMIARKVLRALQTAHSVKIIHRDLKPANIMVQGEGKAESVRVLDFGIATAIGSRDQLKKGFVGSPFYMPPEQFIGETLGFYTDTYSLGVILYECLTGRKPFVGKSPQEVFRNLKRGDYPAAESLRPEINNFAGLPALLAKALERNPERRFQSAREFFDSLNGVISGSPPPELFTLPQTAPETTAPGRRGAARADIAKRSGTAEGRGAAAAAPSLPRKKTERIRRRRTATVERNRSAERGWSMAIGMLLVAGTVFGVLNRDRILQWVGGASDGVETTQATGDPETQAQKRPAETESKKRDEQPSQPQANEPEASTQVVDDQADAEKKIAAWLENAATELDEAGGQAQWEDVIEKAGAILKVSPGDLKAQRWLGLAHHGTGNFQGALASLGAVSDSDPEALSVADLLLLADSALGVAPPRAAEAEDTLETALRREPKNAETILRLGRLYGEAGKTARVAKLKKVAEKFKVSTPELEALWTRVLVEEPKQRQAELAKLLADARASLEKGSPEDALKLARTANERLPSTDAVLLRAEAEMQVANLDGAEVSLQEVADRVDAAVDTDNATEATVAWRTQMYLLRGELHLLRFADKGKRDDLDSAQIAIDQCLVHAQRLERSEAKRVTGLARSWRARIHAHRGDAELASEDLKPTRSVTAIRWVSERARTYQIAGKVASDRDARVESYLSAAGQWNRLLKLDKVPPATAQDARMQLGIAYLRVGSLKDSSRYYKLAANSFSRAEKAGLKSNDLYENWGYAFEGYGQLKPAAEKFLKAFELKPTASNCLRAAEYQIRANPRGDAGLNLLRTGLERFPDDERIKKRYLEATGQARG